MLLLESPAAAQLPEAWVVVAELTSLLVIRSLNTPVLGI